ncbi:DNA repair protein RecN (Recombination protein N) [Lachnospiraceae bacterium YSD2013]|nr:DNA repair protein RecN (Recombination protein N) [Lachnospiraceae bacterium YSD2013]
MLEYMHVRNLALIKDCEISFTKGLNILTGETGAGKSVLLGSVNLALGAKADKEIIRTGEEEAYVELVFSLNESARKTLESMEITADEGTVVVSRKITPTKNVFKINGEIVPAKQVKELAGGLLDIHGQHEHQSLLNNVKQRDMIDAFGGDKVRDALKEVALACEHFNTLKEELENASSKSEGREREISLLKYECDEIEAAELVIGEDEELEEAYKKMQSAEKLLGYVNESMALISGGAEGDAGSLVSRALGLMRKASGLDEGAEKMAEALANVEDMLGDFSLEASRYAESLEFSEEDFVKTEERLNIINSLKLKFGSTIQKILDYYEEKSAELEKLENLTDYIEKLKKDTDAALADYVAKAHTLSELRKSAAEDFSKLLASELLSLSFLDARFNVLIESSESVVNKNGFDNVEFMISTNPGEPMKPIKNVASGGELSRIMLAIKTILAKRDEVDALIFDEIDAGISGRTAWEVSGRLSRLAREHQVIAITHLAQIAASADSHFEIVKNVEDGSTVTNILRLDGDGEIRELARMLGSDSLDEATLTNARELKAKANERKGTV